MKKFIIGITCFSLSFLACAEMTVVSEILIGNSKHKIFSNVENEQSSETYNVTVNESSFAFRFGLRMTDNFSLELSKHDHGTLTNKIIYSIDNTVPEDCCTNGENTSLYETTIPLKIDSLRLGVKGQLAVQENIFINARAGIARWTYDRYTPQGLAIGDTISSERSGNDPYYALGAEYYFKEDLYVGFEYSYFKVKDSFEITNGANGSYKHSIKDLSLIIGWGF